MATRVIVDANVTDAAAYAGYREVGAIRVRTARTDAVLGEGC